MIGSFAAQCDPMPGPPWLHRALSDVGVREIPGAQHHPRILRYLETVGLSRHGDETPWCSAAVATWMAESGVPIDEITGMARSWLRWGNALSVPLHGCVAVLWRGKVSGPSGHVGLVAHAEGERLLLVGGNQSPGGQGPGKVCLAWYPKGRVLGYRWPKDLDDLPDAML